MIKAVLFDLGETLIRPVGPWDSVTERACQALGKTLCESGIDVPCEAFAPEFAAALQAYNGRREENLEEPTTFHLLQDLLRARGLSADDVVIRAGLDAFYRITRPNWRVAEDALAAAEALRRTGLRLGVLSNAGDDEDVRILVRATGLSSYLDFVVTSAQVGFRKPDARAFAAALVNWDFPAHQIIMVGDRLDADIRGAKNSGLRAVWITPSPAVLKPEAPRPDATIGALSELPGLIRQL